MTSTKQIVKSITEPSKHVLWLKDEFLWEFTSEGWTPLGMTPDPGYVRYTEQTLTDAQKEQAKENLGVVYTAHPGTAPYSTVIYTADCPEDERPKTGQYDDDGNYIEDTGLYAFAEGESTIASGYASHAEGESTIASGYVSHAEGEFTIASGYVSHAEGKITTASGDASHAEGDSTTASGDYSHAEGGYTTASGDYSHAEGSHTTASGDYSHAEGGYTTASGDVSHAEGGATTASGDASHAEGDSTTASGDASHSEGYGIEAYNNYMHAQGKYNDYEVDSDGDPIQDNLVDVIGWGEDEDTRKNIETTDQSGNKWHLGEVRVGGTSYATGSKLATETYVDNALNDLNYVNADNISDVAISGSYNDLEDTPITVAQYNDILARLTALENPSA